MSTDLNELYNEVIIKHLSNRDIVHNCKDMQITHSMRNCLCGDHITIGLNCEQDLIHDIKANCSGCALSKASASILLKSVTGLSAKQAGRQIQMVNQFLIDFQDNCALGEMVAFRGIHKFPMRKRCVFLPWQCLHELMQTHQLID